jgi:pimeloyl-ACP methyl ester carboxylesterase
MDKITHRTLEVNGIRIHIAEQGSGPLVVLVHGFPQIWYAWRHQLPFLAEAGYHAVALDLRGHGQSDIPAGVENYTHLHHAGDIIGVINALGEKQAFIVGHDWGSVMASNVALFRPDLVRGLVNLAVPFSPRDPHVDRLTRLRATVGDNVYMQRWQSPEEGEAEADFAKHGTKTALAKILSYHNPEVSKSKNGKTVLESIQLPDRLPSYLKEEDLQYFADNFEKTGFTGGFNFYRNIRRSWELMSPWANKGINTATLFVIGDQDLSFTMWSEYINSPFFKQAVPNLKDIVILPGVGHCLAEEAAEQVNNYILKFFKEIQSRTATL